MPCEMLASRSELRSHRVHSPATAFPGLLTGPLHLRVTSSATLLQSYRA